MAIQAKGISGIKYQGKFEPTRARAEKRTAITPTITGKYSFFLGINKSATKPPIHHPSKGKLKIPTLIRVTSKLIDPIKPLPMLWNNNKSVKSFGARANPQIKYSAPIENAGRQ